MRHVHVLPEEDIHALLCQSEGKLEGLVSQGVVCWHHYPGNRELSEYVIRRKRGRYVVVCLGVTPLVPLVLANVRFDAHVEERVGKDGVIDREKKRGTESLLTYIDSGVAKNEAIGDAEVSLDRHYGNKGCIGPSSRVTHNDDFLRLHTKVVLCILNDPIVDLPAVIWSGRVGILRSESVIHREYRHIQCVCPHSGVSLVGS